VDEVVRGVTPLHRLPHGDGIGQVRLHHSQPGNRRSARAASRDTHRTRSPSTGLSREPTNRVAPVVEPS
jgi:hypothetical protein